MSYNHWFVSRQKRQLTTILPALIAYSDVCLGEKWAGNTELQFKFEDELAKRDITSHGKLRARKAGQGGGGIRTLFKQMKDLGLVFTEDDNGRCRLTLIGEAIVKGEMSFVDAMRMQLQKYQYPSAACWSGRGSVDHSFRVHPFQFVFRLLRAPELENHLTMEEMAYIVIQEADSDSNECFEKVRDWIVAYRAGGNVSDKVIDEIRIEEYMTDEQKKQTRDRAMAYLNIANTLWNYISLTQYVDRGIKTLFIRDGKGEAVDQFIQDSPKLIPNPDLQENYQRAYGRGNSAKDLRDFDKDNSLSQKELNEARIRKEYVLYALHRPITEVTKELVHDVSNNTGIDELVVEKFLRKNYPDGNIDDFFLSYKELAHMGTSGARDFELATCEMFKKIFHMKAEHVGPIGNTPDVFVQSEDGHFCGIIDNKAYKNGYSISGDHKRVMEDVYIPNYQGYGKTDYPLAFFAYIAGSFGKNIDSQIQTIHRDTNVNGSAMPVDLFINLAQDYSKKHMEHEFIKTVFSLNREVRLEDIVS